MAGEETAGQQTPDSSDWAIVVATQGVEPMSGKGRGPKVNVTGLYRGKVTKTYTIVSTEKQEPWVVFECTLSRTPKNGTQFLGITQNVLLPGNATMKNFDRKWKTAALNIAKDPAKLEAPGAKLKLTPKHFIEKDVWIYVQAAPEGKMNNAGYAADPFANLCTPTEAQELAKEEENAGGGAVTTKTAGNGATPQTPPTQSTPTIGAQPKADEFATLD